VSTGPAARALVVTILTSNLPGGGFDDVLGRWPSRRPCAELLTTGSVTFGLEQGGATSRMIADVLLEILPRPERSGKLWLNLIGNASKHAFSSLFGDERILSRLQAQISPWVGRREGTGRPRGSGEVAGRLWSKRSVSRLL